MAITVEPDIARVKVGDKVVWTITVKNLGPDTAVNARAFIDIPDELKLLGFTPSKGTYDPESGIWTIGDVAPGEEVTLILDTEALKDGTIVVKASVISDTFERNLSNNNDTAEIIVEPDSNGTDEPPVDVSVPHKMYATGSPIVMILMSLLAIVGITFKRKC